MSAAHAGLVVLVLVALVVLVVLVWSVLVVLVALVLVVVLVLVVMLVLLLLLYCCSCSCRGQAGQLQPQVSSSYLLASFSAKQMPPCGGQRIRRNSPECNMLLKSKAK